MRKVSKVLQKRLEKVCPGAGHRDIEGYTEDEKRKIVQLNIDPSTIQVNRVVDVNDRALRKIVIGANDRALHETLQRETAFDITAASPLMAILAVSTSLEDLHSRIEDLVIAYDHHGVPITAQDLGNVVWCIYTSTTCPDVVLT